MILSIVKGSKRCIVVGEETPRRKEGKRIEKATTTEARHREKTKGRWRNCEEIRRGDIEERGGKEEEVRGNDEEAARERIRET